MTTTMNTPALRTVPQLKGLPILGNARDFQKDSIGMIDRGWKDAGDIYKAKVGPRSFTVISHPDLAHEVLINQKQIFMRPHEFNGGTILTVLLGLSVLTTDGDTWLSKRRLMQPIFHRQNIVAMGDKMSDAGQQMLQRWQAKGSGAQIDLKHEMKLVTLDIINRTMFSTNVLPEVDKVGNSVDVALEYIQKRTRQFIPLPTSWPTPANNKYNDALSTLDAYLYRIIRERRATTERKGDLLDMLLEARDADTGEGMNDEQVRNEVATIYGAGHETTALALTWTWYALNQHPEVLPKLQHEVDTVLQGRAPTMADLPNLPYTLAVLEESMRLYPPVPLTVRKAYKDAELNGFAIPRGSFVAISINNIHRHPDFWEQPEAFMPERFLPENKAKLNRNGYIPFLTGPHLCIGNNFALMEGQLLLAAMAQQVVLKLVPGQKIEKEVTVTMRPKHGMLMTIEQR